MDKVKWMLPNGAPRYNDDWNKTETVMRGGFKDALSFLGDTFIVSGCTRTQIGVTPIFVFSAGVVCIDGELLNIAQDSFDLDVTPFVYVELLVEDDPAGAGRVFANGAVSPESVYETRKAKYTAYSTAQSGLITYNSLLTAKLLINNMIGDIAWTNVGGSLEAGFSHVSPTGLRYKKEGKYVLIDGVIKVDNATTVINNFYRVFTLPVGLRPLANRVYAVGSDLVTANPSIHVDVVASSGLVLASGVTANNDRLYFNLRIPLD